jgi:hypothetical protein
MSSHDEARNDAMDTYLRRFLHSWVARQPHPHQSQRDIVLRDASLISLKSSAPPILGWVASKVLRSVVRALDYIVGQQPLLYPTTTEHALFHVSGVSPRLARETLLGSTLALNGVFTLASVA